MNVKKKEIQDVRAKLKQEPLVLAKAKEQHQFVASKLSQLLNEDKLLLDLAAGNGNLGIGLNCHYFGIDPIIDTNPDIIKGYAENIPFPNKTFDVVIIKDAINYFEDIEVVFVEIKRVLKTNGQLIITEQVGSNYNIFYQYAKIFLKKMGFARNEWDITYKNYYTSNRLVRLLKNCGYKIETKMHSAQHGRTWFEASKREINT